MMTMNKFLLYSMNHPKKYVINYMCEQIRNISNTIGYTKRPL